MRRKESIGVVTAEASVRLASLRDASLTLALLSRGAGVEGGARLDASGWSVSLGDSRGGPPLNTWHATGCKVDKNHHSSASTPAHDARDVMCCSVM